MIEVPVYNTDGKQVDTLQVEESLFGTEVNCDLVKQAVVTYHANTRQGSAKTKSRSEKAYSTKKMYRQKGTGNARRGSRRSPGLVGGGHTFAKQPRDFRKKLPQKMRQAAVRSAILAKLLGGDLLVLEGLACTEPKTKAMAGVLTNLGINRSCLLALAERDSNVYLSSRNLQDLTVRITEELNAYDVATRQKMIVTSDAMKQLCKQEA
ncbi:MAG: 50S ribosomal protein L4 [Phycisphaerales bacterium]|jgi:large subunit ribosomal protein L4|nr:50S ribosomal protein L4 [Phycisphaerales bacterium]MBT7171547.1 50S ribosomal protein L4 [Phycisphaerales bacterium]